MIILPFIVIPTIFLFFQFKPTLGIFVSFFSTLLIFYYFSKKNRLVLIHLCIIIMAGVVSDHISQVVNILFIPDNNSNNIYIHCFLFIIFFSIFISIYKLIQKKITINLPINVAFLITLIAFITTIVFYLNIFIPTNRIETELVKINVIIQLGYFVLMIILFSFLLQNIKKANELKNKEIKQEQFTQYMHSLEQVNKDMQKFRHDYTNILLTIRGYLDNDNLKELKLYFQESILKTEQHTLLKNHIFNQLENIKIFELKGLLATKISLADSMNIPINVEVPDNIYTVHMETIDFARILGVLFDNAIEASLNRDNPKINLAFIKKNNDVIFIIENYIEDISIDINQLFEENYSTNGINRGIGLSNVRNIINKYYNVTINTRNDKKWFIQEVEIRE